MSHILDEPVERRSRRTPVAIGLALVVLVAAGSAAFVLLRSGDDEPGPDATAREFASAWEGGDVDVLRGLVVDAASLDAVDPVAIAEDLGTTSTAVTVGVVDEDSEPAVAEVTVTLTLGDVGDVGWDATWPLVDVEDEGWRVDWSEAALHPRMPEGGSLRRDTTWPERAPILGVDGQPLVSEVETIRVGIEPRRFDREASIPILAEELGLDPAAIVAALDAPGVQPDHFVQIAELRPAAFEAVREVIFPIPGVLFPRATARGGPTEGFARHLVGRFGEVTAERLEELGSPYAVGDRVGLDGLEARFEPQLAGLPAVEVGVVDAEGEVVTQLATFPATEPEPVVTTIDPALQAAAEAALVDVTVPAAFVVVDAATGEVRASVARPLGEAFNRAVGGEYPPGSTFKVITGHALLTSGLQPTSPVDCPPELVVDGRRFRNFEGGSSGTVPFSRAFAQSCNTAVIGAAGSLPEGALAESAAAFGFGLDYTLGATTLGGSFPDPTTAVERAASAIGQAQVTASPLHMATVAAAVLDGTWRSPRLLPGVADDQVTLSLDPAVREQLAGLMRLVVTEGSGTAADISGLDVIGKTGTAEFGEDDPPATHAWFIGAADGLGFAVLLEGGGVGGRDAAPIAARFLETLAG
jgi:cell division protein FtsI/penicillin-binding protein 2